MFAVIFVYGNLFLRIAGKTAKIAKIRTRKNFMPRTQYITEKIKKFVTLEPTAS